MRGLLQRVSGARVEVAGEIVGSIDQGLLVLVAVEPGDTEASAAKMLHKLLNYRVFSDCEGKMNLSLADIGGGLLLVSQFTLAADTKNGLRPSFSTAAPPALAQALRRTRSRDFTRSSWEVASMAATAPGFPGIHARARRPRPAAS